MKQSNLSILVLLGLILGGLLLVLSGFTIYIYTNYHNLAEMNKSVKQTWKQLEQQVKIKQSLLAQMMDNNSSSANSRNAIQQLQNEIKTMEQAVNKQGEQYNKLVKRFNQNLQLFPKNIIAGWTKIKEAQLFKTVNQNSQ